MKPVWITYGVICTLMSMAMVMMYIGADNANSRALIILPIMTLSAGMVMAGAALGIIHVLIKAVRK